jgi:hypothetical protein
MIDYVNPLVLLCLLGFAQCTLDQFKVKEVNYYLPFTTSDTACATVNYVTCEIYACEGDRFTASACRDYADDWDNYFDFDSESCSGDQLFILRSRSQ